MLVINMQIIMRLTKKFIKSKSNYITRIVKVTTKTTAATTQQQQQ